MKAIGKILDKINNLQISVEAGHGPLGYIDIIETVKIGLEAGTMPSRSQMVLLNTIAKQYPLKIREVVDKKTGKKKFTGKLTENKRFCRGWDVVFTGFRNKDWEELIKERGGRVGTNVTNSTTHVISKNTNKRTGKLKKAEAVGSEIIKAENFLTLLEDK